MGTHILCFGTIRRKIGKPMHTPVLKVVFMGYIRKTCPCNVYPLKPHFYIVKLGFAGVYLFFLFLLLNIDCGYSLEPPRRGGSNVYLQSMFSAENFHFLSSNNLCLLHGQVFVMLWGYKLQARK